MPDDVKPDDPSDSAETLRIMADLERYADMHAPTLSDSADVMDEARHRLAVLQQACNAYPGLRARVAALEAENAKLRELLDKADEMVPWFRQGTIWVGGRADHAERVIAGLDQLSPMKYTQECVDTFRGWVNETHKRIGEYESSRAALAPKEHQ